MSESVQRWCSEELKKSFGLEASDDIIKYILSMDSPEEMCEYLSALLQDTKDTTEQFIHELLLRKQQTEPLIEGKKEPLKKPKRKGRNKQETLASEPQPQQQEVKTPIDLMKVQDESGLSAGKRKAKFVNLYAKEGQDRMCVLLPGRHACQCLAQKHTLVNNCLSCGRIVCEQEGSGACFFCGSLVCTKEEQEILQRDSNKSQKLRKKLLGADEVKEGLENAVRHKNKLLEFDRNSVRRTQVLDDESDYFATDTNQWLSPAERENMRKRDEELRKIRHASHITHKITLDFAGRQVLEEKYNDMGHYYRKFDKAVQDIIHGQDHAEEKQKLRELLNPNITLSAPQWVDVGIYEGVKKLGWQEPGKGVEPDRTKLRLQDAELQELSDGGWCLSMHQPWASLLVRGIKRMEGRVWYSSHRGRLWIAAAAKRPQPEEITQVENMYRRLYSSTELHFPSEYPTGCLLGCVNVIDVLPQEQFKEQHLHTCEESASPFVFICSDPKELLVKFPTKGRHKIWKLDSKCHQAARKGLMQLLPRARTGSVGGRK